MSKIRGGPSDESIQLHELLTPLNHITGFTDLLLEELDRSSKDDIRADVVKIRNAADRMLDVIHHARTSHIEIAMPTVVVEDKKNHAASEGSVLVVDDDVNNRILIARNLRKRGFDVTDADDGVEALRLIDKKSFDVVLLDIVMPIMDGVDLLQRIHERFGDKLPVMIISALDDLEIVEKCLELDAVDFITKPYEPYILIAKVRAMIRRNRRRERTNPSH